MKRMGTVLVILLGLVLQTGGCSGKKEALVPPPVLPTAVERKEDQARKLQDIAFRVAEQVDSAVQAKPELAFVPIYMRPPNETIFSRSFHQLLAGALVARGLKLSVQQEDALVLDYTVLDDVLLSVSLTYDNRYVVYATSVEYVGRTGADSQILDSVWSRYAKRRPANIR